MATIVTRSGKGSPLTHAEVDANFTNLNTDKLELSGGTMTGNLSFGDNDKAIFGAINPLEIYHDGTNKYIQDTGSGSLFIRGSDLVLEDDGGNDYITMSDTGTGGTVTLKHNASTKLATTSTGIDVTGTVTADKLTLNNASTIVEIESSNTNARLDFIASRTSSNLTSFLFKDNADKSKLSIGQNGDISFYEDTGTTAKFFWDASAESLGIGTTSPSALVDISKSGTGDYSTLKLSNTGASGRKYELGVGGSGTGNYAGKFYVYDSTAGQPRFSLDSSGNVGIGTISPDNSLHISYTDSTAYSDATHDAGIQIENTDTTTNSFSQLHFRTGNSDSYIRNIREGDNLASLAFLTDDGGVTGDVGEAMRIDSSGRVGIGTSSPAYALDVQDDDATRHLRVFRNASGTSAIMVQNADTGSGSNDGLQISVLNGGDAQIANLENTNLRFLTNSTERMRIDSSGNVGIGTSSVDRGKLHVNHYNSISAGVFNDAHLALTFNTAPSDNDGYAGITYATSDSDNYGWSVGARRTNSGVGDFVFTQHTNSATGSERMRIDSSGNLLVGRTTLSGTDNTSGAYIFNEGALVAQRSSNPSLYLNRYGTDGDIALFRKDGSTVGSIGVVSSQPYFVSGNTGIRLSDANNGIFPAESDGTNRDAAINLGASASRFKDLYLSGGVYLGGTGSANKLDDYEEGTFTVTLTGSSSGDIPLNADTAYYTKIGDMVYITGEVRINSTQTVTATGTYININGLPFTSNSDTNLRPAGALALQHDGTTWAPQAGGVATNGTKWIMEYDPDLISRSSTTLQLRMQLNYKV
jgi:hypothetical protein